MTELGTHYLSPAELNTIFAWARKHNERYPHIMQFLSGEHKFPFIEFECFSRRVACIKMTGQSHLKVSPETGVSLAFWLNIRSASPTAPELLLCSLWRCDTSTSVLELRYHCQNGSILIKLGDEESFDSYVCRDVMLAHHRWYHIAVTFQMVCGSQSNLKQKTRPHLDLWLYINGIKAKHIHETIMLKEKESKLEKETLHKRSDTRSSVVSIAPNTSLGDIKAPQKCFSGLSLDPCLCQLIIGVDRTHLKHQEHTATRPQPLVWWMGPFFVFESVLSLKQVVMIVDAGADYGGTFHDARAVSYIQEKEEKLSHCPNRIDVLPTILCSIHPHAYYSFTEARRILQPNTTDLDMEELSPLLMGANNNDVSPLQEMVNIAALRTPGAIVKNTAHHVHAPITHQGPYLYCYGGVTCIRPIALEDAIRYIGGIENIFGFLSNVHSSKALVDYCAILATFLANNPRNLMDMARIGGYEMLGNILKEKSGLITLDLIPIITSMVTNSIPTVVREYFTHTPNSTRNVRISDPEIALYNHIGNPESSYKKRIYTMAMPAQRTPNMDDMDQSSNANLPVTLPLLLHNNSSTHNRSIDGSTMELSALGHLGMKHSGSESSTVNEPLNNMLSSSVDNVGTGIGAGDDVSLGLDYVELRQKGLSFLELPIVIERRYLQQEDESGLTEGYSEMKESTWSGSERYTKEKMLLANTLAMKYLLFDYEIWSQVSTPIQHALYEWVKELATRGPPILNMEGMHKTLQFHRISGIPLKALSLLSMRKWNAMRLRDLEVMDDILHILVHRRVPSEIKSVIFELAERLITENFREEELNLIAGFLVDNVVDHKNYESVTSHANKQKELAKEKYKTKDDFSAQPVTMPMSLAMTIPNKNVPHYMDVNSTPSTATSMLTPIPMSTPIPTATPIAMQSPMFTPIAHVPRVVPTVMTTATWNHMNTPIKHGDVVVEFMKIFYVYVHNNTVGSNGHFQKANSHAGHHHSNSKGSCNDDDLNNKSPSPSSLGFGHSGMDAEFTTNFANMCDKFNILWFAKFLSPGLSGQVNRASLCVLNKMMITVDNYMNAFCNASGFQILAMLIPRLEPHPRVWIFLFSLLLGMEPFRCGAVNSQPQLPFTLRSMTELFPVTKINAFQAQHQTRTLALLLSVIHDYVQLYVAGNSVDVGYAVVAIKFLWQNLKTNRRIRDEFVGDEHAHIEFFVSILFDITYAKSIHQWISRGGFNCGCMSLYLPVHGVPELDNVLSSLLIKLLEERIQKHKVYITFDRILRAFPTRRIKKDQQADNQKKLIQFYCVKMVCSCLHKLQIVTDKDLLLHNLMFVSNVRHLVEISSLTLQNYFAFYLLPSTKTKSTAYDGTDNLSPSQSHSHSQSQSSSPSPSPAITTMDKPSSKRERRHSFHEDLLRPDRQPITQKSMIAMEHNSNNTKQPSTLAQGNKTTGQQDESPAFVCSSYLEQIPSPAKIIRRFLSILQMCKLTLDQRLSVNDGATEEKNEREPSRKDLENLYSSCRKSVQSVLIFFMHKSLELSSKTRHLEKLLLLVIQHHQVLFFTDSSEPDFFFLGLMHVLVKLLPEVAKHGDKVTLSQTKEHVAHNCLSVWNCVLMYQSHFLAQYLSKEPELNDKLRLIVTKRALFLQWLRRGGLTTAQSTFQAIFEKPWADRYANESSRLRERFDKDKTSSKTQHQNLLSYERLLKFIPMQAIYQNNNIQTLLSVEQARQISRKHQFYYRELFSRNKWFELVVLKLRVQSTLWVQLITCPWDEAWYLDFIEGPHRMRKILKRHTKFVQIYKADRHKFLRLLSQLEPMKQFMNDYYSHDTRPLQVYSQSLAAHSSNPSVIDISRAIALSESESADYINAQDEHDSEISDLKALEAMLEDSREHDFDDSEGEKEEEDEDDEENEEDKGEVDKDTKEFAKVNRQGSNQNNDNENNNDKKEDMSNDEKDEEDEKGGNGGHLSKKNAIFRIKENNLQDNKFPIKRAPITRRRTTHYYQQSLAFLPGDKKLEDLWKGSKLTFLAETKGIEEEQLDNNDEKLNENENENENENKENRDDDVFAYNNDDWKEEKEEQQSSDDTAENEERETTQENAMEGILPFEQDIIQMSLDKEKATLGIVERMSRVLGPGDVFDPTRTYNCSTISGLNEDHGIVLLCRTAMYFFYHIRLDVATGELKEIKVDMQSKVAFRTSFDMKNSELGPLLTIKKIRSKRDIIALQLNGNLSRAKQLEEMDKDATGLKEPLRFTYDSLRE
ncbi:hypothetical protein RFI_13881, partial [Reticulomyxa filosa]